MRRRAKRYKKESFDEKLDNNRAKRPVIEMNLDSSSTPYRPWKALCKLYFRVFINAFMGVPPEVMGFLYALIIAGDAKVLLKREKKVKDLMDLLYRVDGNYFMMKRKRNTPCSAYPRRSMSPSPIKEKRELYPSSLCSRRWIR